MALDVGAFSRYGSFPDYARAEQEFQLKKQAAQMDQETKKIQLMGQIVGNATDQDSYNRTRDYVQKLGIDASALPEQFNPELVSRLRFAGATPTAQLSALIASQGHALRAGQAVGDVGAYGYGANSGPMPVAPQPQAQPEPQAAPNNVAPQPLPAEVLPPTGQPVSVTPVQGSNPSGNTSQVAATGSNILPNGTPDNAVVNYAPQPVAPAKPQQRPGETTQAYENRLKNDAVFQSGLEASKANATQKGKDLAEADKGAIAADQTFGRLQKNLDALKTINDSLPEYGGILPVSAKARAGLIAGDYGDKGAGYDALQKWNEVNQQQVVNAIGELVKGGQIRGNQYIERIINRGFAIDPDAPRQTRKDEIETLRNELQNAAIQAQNTKAALTGGNQQGYVSTLPQKFAPNSKEYDETIYNAKKAAKNGKDKVEIKRRLLANGINPADAGL